MLLARKMSALHGILLGHQDWHVVFASKPDVFPLVRVVIWKRSFRKFQTQTPKMRKETTGIADAGNGPQSGADKRRERPLAGIIQEVDRIIT